MAALHKYTQDCLNQQYLKQQQNKEQQPQSLCSQNTLVKPLTFTFNSTLHFNFCPQSQATETERNKFIRIVSVRVCLVVFL